MNRRKSLKMKAQLNSNHLELIAITAMTIDYIADLIYPAFPANPIAVILHIVGRLLYCGY